MLFRSQMQSGALNQYVSLTFKVEQMEKMKDGPWTGQFRAHADVPGNEHLKYSIYSYFAESEDVNRLERVRKGAVIRTNGVITRCDIGKKGFLNIDIFDATMSTP